MPYNTTHNFELMQGNYNVGRTSEDSLVTRKRFIDFSTYNLERDAFYKLWEVPANFAILEAYGICETAEGADTFDIVDDDTPTTTILNDVSLAAAGTVTNTNARKMYTDTGYICIMPNADLTTGAAEIVIIGVNVKTTD